MMRILALSLLGACTFSTDVPGPGEEEGDGTVMPTPSMRCLASGLSVCVDFEDMPSPKDGIAPEATITAANVIPQTRLTDEWSAQLQPLSQLRIADTAKLDIAQTLTIEMWTKPTAIPLDAGDKQVGLFDTLGQYQLNFEADRQIECLIHGTGGDENIDSVAKISIAAWHHVACTYDGTVLKVYVDGKLEGCKQTAETVAVAGTAGAAIGANMAAGPTYKNPFVGELDNVHLYARALTSAEICTLWGNGGCKDTCPPTNSGPGPGPQGGDD